MLHIGIDPGLTGAIAVLKGGAVVGLYDMPVVKKVHGKGNQVDAPGLCNMIRNLMRGRDEIEATMYIEQMAPMPGQGVTSMFGLGRTAGVIEGIRAALGFPGYYLRPQQWKRPAGITGKDKDAARALAAQLYPTAANLLTRVKDDGRAEAILIAHYGQLLAKGEK